MKLTLREIIIFALLGAVMFVSKIVMEALPNIHLLGVFTIAFTVVYRQKALYPICVYVLLNGLFAGFSPWWVPHLYLWTVLWGVTMLLPRNMKPAIAAVVYPVVCAAHGFLYGVLYAPAQALLFGLDFQGMLAWIAAGLPFDITHGIGNAACGLLIMPIAAVLRIANRASLQRN